jgi:hypothetical protein
MLKQRSAGVALLVLALAGCGSLGFEDDAGALKGLPVPPPGGGPPCDVLGFAKGLGALQRGDALTRVESLSATSGYHHFYYPGGLAGAAPFVLKSRAFAPWLFIYDTSGTYLGHAAGAVDPKYGPWYAVGNLPAADLQLVVTSEENVGLCPGSASMGEYKLTAQ